VTDTSATGNKVGVSTTGYDVDQIRADILKNIKTKAGNPGVKVHIAGHVSIDINETGLSKIVYKGNAN
jgi:hypothetical protein